jgi:hypothetical protein
MYLSINVSNVYTKCLMHVTMFILTSAINDSLLSSHCVTNIRSPFSVSSPKYFVFVITLFQIHRFSKIFF